MRDTRCTGRWMVTIHRSEGWLGFDAECVPSTPTGDVSSIVRALEPEVVCVIWNTIEPLLPDRNDDHPSCRVRPCHRPGPVRRSDTTLRARRDEWIAADVFSRLEAEARARRGSTSKRSWAVGPRAQGRVPATSGWIYWRDYTAAPWHENGTEQAAEIMVWGLIDRPLEMIRIDQYTCDELDDGYRTLTGQPPLHGFRDFC